LITCKPLFPPSGFHRLTILPFASFEKDEISQPYLALLSESQKEELKTEISTSPTLIMSAQMGTPIDDIPSDWLVEMDDILMSTDPIETIGQDEDPTLFPAPLEFASQLDYSETETKVIEALLSQMRKDAGEATSTSS
jgi:hypothetical protein